MPQPWRCWNNLQVQCLADVIKSSSLPVGRSMDSEICKTDVSGTKSRNSKVRAKRFMNLKLLILLSLALCRHMFEHAYMKGARHRTRTKELHVSPISYGILGTILVPRGCGRYRRVIVATGLPYVFTSLQQALILLNPRIHHIKPSPHDYLITQHKSSILDPMSSFESCTSLGACNRQIHTGVSRLLSIFRRRNIPQSRCRYQFTALR